MNELDDDDRKYNGMPLEQLCGSSGRRDQVVALARWVGETYGDSVPLVFRVSMALRCLKCTSWSNDAAKMTFQRQALQMIDDAKRQRAAAADDDDDAAPGALLAAAPSDHLAPPPPRPRWPTSVVRPRTGPSETAVPMAVDEKCTLQLMLLGEPGDGKPATIPLRPDGVTTIGRNGEVNLALEHSLCAAITSSPGMAPTIVAYINGVCIGGSKFVCTACPHPAGHHSSPTLWASRAWLTTGMQASLSRARRCPPRLRLGAGREGQLQRQRPRPRECPGLALRSRTTSASPLSVTICATSCSGFAWTTSAQKIA